LGNESIFIPAEVSEIIFRTNDWRLGILLGMRIGTATNTITLMDAYCTVTRGAAPSLVLNSDKFFEARL